MRSFIILVFPIFFLSSTLLHADECTHLWAPVYDTNPLSPKGHSGDTSAAYIGFAYYGKPDYKFVLKGSFPRARFMSLETYQTRFSQRIDSVMDYQIQADAGSQNPFTSGTSIETVRRNFTLQIVPESMSIGAANTLHLPENRLIHSFLYRIYSPANGVKIGPKDLPRLYAYDAYTGKPRACPAMFEVSVYLDLPQMILRPIPKLLSFELRELKYFSIGANNAVPNYLFKYVRVDQGRDVVVLKFKAPTFLNLQSGMGEFKSNGEETRYWSMCFQNVMKNITLACLPDHLANVDNNGMVTLVFGRGPGIEKTAKERGFNFIEDRRTPDQEVLAMLYRNILPKNEFKEGMMYHGSYIPRGILCAAKDFISGACGR